VASLVAHPAPFSQTQTSACGEPPILSPRGIYSDDQVDRVWILDVDGQRRVVNAAYGPRSTAAERDKLTSMVRSLKFEPATRDYAQ
jgi:hypothetical protein